MISLEKWNELVAQTMRDIKELEDQERRGDTICPECNGKCITDEVPPMFPTYIVCKRCNGKGRT